MIRHALPICRELESGAADPELSEDGRAQAAHLAQYLSSEHLDAVYASTMQRARQTAEPVAQQRGLDIGLRDGITEFDRFSSEYIPVEELKASNDPRWQEMLDGVWDGDETQDQFHERTVGTIEEIVATHRGERVAVVCHGGVINAYLTTILGLTGEFNSSLLADRAQVLNQFEEIHSGSGSDDVLVAVQELNDLKSADQALRAYCRSEKNALAIEMNQSAQRQGAPTPPEYPALNIPLIDRKA